ncbi:unnamed protein product, partial [Staurois parvus]
SAQQCLPPVPSSAFHQCPAVAQQCHPSVLPSICAHHCPAMSPISAHRFHPSVPNSVASKCHHAAHQCSLSVTIIAAYQCSIISASSSMPTCATSS